MEKEFVTYEQALALKELGFDEPCIYAFCNKGGWNKYKMVKEPIVQVLRTDGNPFGQYFNGKNWNAEFSPNNNKIQCSAPTFSQAFRWFREKYDLQYTITWNKHYPKTPYEWGVRKSWRDEPLRPYGISGMSATYEEAESACLDKLIKNT